MTMIEVTLNLISLLVGLALMSKGLSDKRTNYPKWFCIGEIILGVGVALYCFSVWFNLFT